MATEIKMYRTVDGELFNRECRAREHEENLLLYRVECMLNRIFPGAHRPSLITATKQLVDNPEQSVTELEKILELLKESL